MDNRLVFDIVIIGGGLAGLSLAILQAKQQRSVLLIEKGDYPRHKVCGEYISMESWNFIERLGITLRDMDLPQINQFKISGESGQLLASELDLGGFGISRYMLEDLLYKEALKQGVHIKTNTKYLSSKLNANGHYKVQTTGGEFTTQILCAAFGKYAPSDLYKPLGTKHNWVGVKYHIRYHHAVNEIVLHNFDNGYCGMSKIEDDKSCLCYLVNAKQLKACNNDIKQLEKAVLRKNPYLDKIFREAEFVFDKPKVISNVTFEVRKPVHNDIFYLGDSAGTIAPLSGNGMSNAFRSAHLLNKSLNSYFSKQISFTELLESYEKTWAESFVSRINMGRFLQHFFCKKYLNAASIFLLKNAKFLHKYIIRKTHGNVF